MRLARRLSCSVGDAGKPWQSFHQTTPRNLAIVTIGRGRRERQGLNSAAAYVKYHSVGRMSAGSLIFSDSTLKTKSVYRFSIATG